MRQQTNKINQLKNQTDTGIVSSELQAIMKAAIKAQQSQSKALNDKALNEITAIKKALLKREIDAGEKTSEYAAAMTQLIKNMQNAADVSSNAAGEGLADSISKSIPSTDSLVSALTSANPLLGFGVKFVRDAIKKAKEVKQKEKADRAKRLEVLKQQEESILQQIELLNKQEEVTQKQDQEIEKTKREYKKGGIYKPVLDEIRDEIKKLETLLTSPESEKVATVEQEKEMEQLDLFQEQQSQTDEIVNALERNAETVSDTLEDIHDTEERNRKDKERRERLSRVDRNNKELDLPEHVASKTTSEGSGGFAGVFGLLRALGGLGILSMSGGIIATILSPIKALIGFVVAVGRMALSLGSRLLLPVAIISGIIEFFDGFFNADKILGKLDSDVTLGERVMVGLAAVQAAIVNIVDSILEFFGFDIIDTENLTKRIYDFQMGLIDKGIEVLKDIQGVITTAYDEAVNSVTSLFDTVVEKFTEIKEMLTEKVDEIKNFFMPDSGSFFDNMSNMFSSGVEQGENILTESWRNSSDYMGQVYDNITDDHEPDAVTRATETGYDKFVEPKPFKLETIPVFEERFYDGDSIKQREYERFGELIRQEMLEEMNNTANLTQVNAPVSNSTNVKNNINQVYNTANLNPRLRLAHS